MSVPRYLLALLLASAAGMAQAVEFDANLKAPKAVSGADLKTRLDGVAARAAGSNAEGALDTVRDQALARERFDARWMLGNLVDAKVPLPELEAMGFTPKGDGSYSIDVGEHPEWRSLTDNLLLLSESSMVASLEGTFVARGFRPEDFSALQTYVREHNLKRARDQGQLAMIISASKMAKKLQKSKRLDDAFMASYFYQKQLRAAEIDRQWATGLLDALEPRAQRVLESYLSELGGTSFIAPTDNTAAYKYERELLLRADLEQMARTAFEEGKL